MSTAVTTAYADTLQFTSQFSQLSLAGAQTLCHSPRGQGRWTREPITLLKRDIYSRFVVFDGKKEPYIEPHFMKSSDHPGRDPSFDALVEARWYEYLAESYLRASGSKQTARGSVEDETRVNTPVQLYLAHSRLARAQLEIKIYTQLLEDELGPSLREEFERVKEQSLPEGGLFGESCTVSRIRSVTTLPVK